MSKAHDQRTARPGRVASRVRREAPSGRLAAGALPVPEPGSGDRQAVSASVSINWLRRAVRLRYWNLADCFPCRCK